MTWKRRDIQRTEWKKLICPCAQTHYISIIQRETDSTWSDKGGHHSSAAEFWQQHDEDEWTGQLSQPRHVLLLKKWYIYQPCNHFSNDQGLQFFFLMCTIAVFHKINWPYIFLYCRMIFIKQNEWKLKTQLHKNSLDSWVSSLYRRVLLECKETAVNCVLVMQGDVPMEMSILIAY